MRLCIFHHLQAVFEAAEEPIVFDQPLSGCSIDAAGRREATQCFACWRNLQFLQSTAPDQLLRLREKFDLPDAALPGFDVVPGNRDSPASAISVDLTLDRMDVLDRREIEVFSPNERAQL